MSIPGVGYRFAADVLCEVSLHLIEPICYTSLTSISQPGGFGTGGFAQYGFGSGAPSVLKFASNEALYVGAKIIIGWGLETQEVVTVVGLTALGYVYTTALANDHDTGEVVMAPTFPTQQVTDPHYTQDEMLGYLARAQNEFLADCPVNYQLTQQALAYGQVLQNTPSDCIEINRIAASQYYSALVSLTRADGIVTAVTQAPHGLQKGSTVTVQNEAAGFTGAFQLASILSPTSYTYVQDGDDAAADGGVVVYFARIYETTQTELSMANRTWRNEYLNVPTAWAEDRAGLYKWYVNGKPSSNFPVELLMSVRDADSLTLLDGFLVPDLMMYIVKFKVLEYALSKDGVQQDPSRAAYCRSRYERGVMTVNRYLLGTSMGLKAAS